MCMCQFNVALYASIGIDLVDAIQGKSRKVVQAQNLWFEILKSQIETGTPYMLFKVL